MTTIATPPAAVLDALLDRLSAGKPLTAAEADLLRAGVTGLRRTAGGLQRRSQQQAARISELEQQAAPREQCGSTAYLPLGGGQVECVLRPNHSGGHADERDQRWRLTAPEPALRDRLAAAIRAATCPGECDGREYCEHGRFQPTVWDDQQRPVEVGISGPPERIAALIAGALIEAADEETAEHHFVDGAKYLCHADDHYCPPGNAA
ncbi:hypothetical protein CLM85_14085 [Streptomyces albidoflavus]|uniref:hypothetical protein n=1 Tax=Streptomyces albidoflavus TaxID=1886 RepID=UPI000BADDC5D|nr:hypothetical protein [Streptomyces albidoflavus]PAX92151.1 hypothetical protein CLM82_05145 [Streptomyces albidoflavus]PBO16072.1 hypothetical protein CLM83_26125 [Streptomyces albidoflavus]PBO23783.1 hypothetical protein CLM85_14085 [Streptomyces albidoflavus]PBO29762.1 hypothetical protein CLM84_12325 [Streptomyces albidoflavus]